MKIHPHHKEKIISNYSRGNLKPLMIETGLSEHYVKDIARKAGLIKKRRPLVEFNEQLVQFRVSVRRKHLNMVQKEIDKFILKYR